MIFSRSPFICGFSDRPARIIESSQPLSQTNILDALTMEASAE
jgi:hypothetical protein